MATTKTDTKVKSQEQKNAIKTKQFRDFMSVDSE